MSRKVLCLPQQALLAAPEDPRAPHSSTHSLFSWPERPSPGPSTPYLRTKRLWEVGKGRQDAAIRQMATLLV